MKNFRNLSEELTPSSKPEPGRQAIGGRFTSASPKRPTKPAPLVTSEENISEIVMPHVKSDLSTLDKTSFVKKHGITKSVARAKVTEAKDEKEYGYEGDMALNQLATLTRCADMIKELLKPDTDMPEWVQSKITLATDYIQTAADYMYSEMNESKEVGDIPSGDENPPNVGLKKGKTVITNTVAEASSAAVRMAKALQRAKEQREREERAGAALLNPKKPEPVKEEVMQEREDDEYHTPTRHHVQVQVSKGDGPKQHRKATVRAKEPSHAVSAAIAHYKQQGYTVHDHKYLGEEVEQIDIEEGAKETAQKAINLADKLRKKDPEKSKIYRNLGIKASQRSNNPTGVKAGQPHGSGNKALRKQGIEPVPSSMSSSKMRGYFEEVELDEVKMADLPSTKVQGRAYGASKPEPHALDLTKGPKDKELKNIDAEKKKKFSEMINLYQDGGMKSFMESLSKEEEEKIIDEVSKEIADYTMDVIDAGEYTEVTIGEEASQEEFNAEIEKAKAKSQGKVKAEVAKAAVQAVKQEEVELGEDRMNDAEMEKREKIVKGMKKGMEGFKERYGARAKNVMYATSTKIAKEKA